MEKLARLGAVPDYRWDAATLTTERRDDHFVTRLSVPVAGVLIGVVKPRPTPDKD